MCIRDSAYPMLGRTPPHIRVVRPLRDGVISDYRVTEIMLRHFFLQHLGHIAGQLAVNLRQPLHHVLMDR